MLKKISYATDTTWTLQSFRAEVRRRCLGGAPTYSNHPAVDPKYAVPETTITVDTPEIRRSLINIFANGYYAEETVRQNCEDSLRSLCHPDALSNEPPIDFDSFNFDVRRVLAELGIHGNVKELWYADTSDYGPFEE